MNEKKQVLFVDDDQLILLCYKRALSKHFSMEIALGPAQAIEALDQGEFAVVASDMRMPGMNGIRLLEMIKGKSPDTVGILLSGNADLNDAEICGRRDLVFRLLSKPCATPELVMAIEEALEQHHHNVEAKAR